MMNVFIKTEYSSNKELIENLKSLEYSDIQAKYKKYIEQKSYSSNTVSTMSADCFYLWNNGSKELFWRVVLSSDFENIAPVELKKALSANSKGNVDNLITGYVSQLRRFKSFVEAICKSKSTGIDFIGVLKYVSDNRELEYKDSETVGLSNEEIDKYKAIKTNGEEVVAEIQKMADLCAERFSLSNCSEVSWLDGSKTKTKKYLNVQMQYKDYNDNPACISIYVEYTSEAGAYYRIGLDVKGDAANKAVLQQFHKHLDLENKDLKYALGANAWGVPEVICESQPEIKEKVANGKYRKVQICGYIENIPYADNDYYENQLLGTVEKLIPYYKTSIGLLPLQDELKEAHNEIDDNSYLGLEENKVKYDKNMILYGPPGTGKTYKSAIYAVAICDNKDIRELTDTDYKAVMKRFNELKAEGRISFTTFHQSYGYEEFIEGIKPNIEDGAEDLQYKIEAGVFKRFCENARSPELASYSSNGTIWSVRNRAIDEDVKFDLNQYMYENGIILAENLTDVNRQCNLFAKMNHGDIVVLGRLEKIDAVGVIDDYEPQQIDKEPFQYQRKVKWLVQNIDKSFSDIGKPGMCLSNFAAAKSKLNTRDISALIDANADNTKPCVFIIDEINRGNISKIFGELITLIEDTKRAGMQEAASAVLPYSGETFSVPANVYLLGTMNTADRSIALMDTALRRRFSFVELMPDETLLEGIKVEGVDIEKMLRKINERIAILYDREHTIGHAFFIKLKKDPTLENLKAIFKKSVVPLLQEYFYEDWQKIQLVLGDNAKTEDKYKFILDEKVLPKDVFKGNVDEVIDIDKKYIINEKAFDSIQSYELII